MAGWRCLALCSVAACALTAFAWQSAVAEGEASRSRAAPKPAEAASAVPGIENFIELTPRLSSGGEPHDDAAFAALVARGVRTIVSVDGAKPDIATAKKHGLRYVHIPIGYDGVDRTSQLALVRVMREVPGPVFVHCHHGKHRGPAAAAVACRAIGAMTADEAAKYLAKAGTGKEYPGLWRDVAAFRDVEPNEKLPPLQEIAKVSSLAGQMAVLDRQWDDLKLCAQANWETPQGHADLSPEHQAVLIWESLREAERFVEVDREVLLAELGDAEHVAAELRDALAAKDRTKAADRFAVLGQRCIDCHAKQRN